MLATKRRFMPTVYAFALIALIGPIPGSGAPPALAQPTCTNGDCEPPPCTNGDCGPPTCTNGDCPQVPEPATWLLLASGLLGWIGYSAWLNRGRRRAEAPKPRA